VTRLRIAPAARRDLERIFQESEEGFGARVADRYRRLVSAALRDLGADPERLGVRHREGLPEDVRLYHLRHSRGRDRDRIARPRHFLMLRRVGSDVVLVRVLHDAMDLPRHLDENAEEP
jgi:toxin ParE1/3/4